MQDSHADVRRLFERLIAVYVFVIVLALYPFTGDPTGDIKWLLVAWSSCLLAGGWTFVAWWNRIPTRKPAAFGLPLAGLLVLYFVATLRSAYPMISVLETGRFLSLAALYLVASQVYTTPESVRRLLKTLLFASVAATLYGFLQAGGVDPVPWDTADKKTDVYMGLPASYGNPNFAAHVMVLTLPIAVYLLVTERAWFWLAAAIVTVIHLRMTGQRASYIALAGAVTLVGIAWTILRIQRKPARVVLGSLGAWVLLGLFGVIAGMGLLAWRTGSPLPLDTSLHIRYWSYVSATDMIKDAPVLGHGPAVYGYAYPRYWTQLEKEWFIQEGRKNKHVHNDLMEISVDAGVPAAGLYLLTLLLAMGYSLAWAARAELRDRGLGLLFAALFAGFLLDGLFGFNLRVPVSASFVFLLLGALEGLLSTPGPEVEKRRWRTANSVGLVGLTAVAVLVSCDFSGANHLFLGERELRLNHLSEAKQEFRLGEALAPWNALFALQTSKAEFANKNPEGAVKELERMFAIDPNYFSARLTLARYHILLAQQALTTDPQHAETPLEHLTAATDAANAMLAICDQHPVALKLRGRAAAASAVALTTADKVSGVERAKPYWDAADKDLEAALHTAREEKGDTYRLLAQVKLALNKPLEAEEAYSRAAKDEPNEAATWGQFLTFANGNHRYERLRNTLVAVIGTLTSAPEPRKDVLSLLRMCLANVQENGYNDFDHAAEEYREAAAASPLSPEVWSNFARFAFQRGRVDDLKASLKSAQEEFIRDKKEIPAQLRVVFASLQDNVKALEDASSVLVAQVRSFPADNKISAQQTYEWTARLLRDKVNGEPADKQGVTRLNLGIVFAQFKDYASADALYAAAAGHLPDPLIATHAAMWSETLLELNRGQDAINLIEPLREHYGQDFDLRHAYARALVKTGHLPEAKEEYTKLLAEPELGTTGRAMLQQEVDALQ